MPSTISHTSCCCSVIFFFPLCSLASAEPLALTIPAAADCVVQTRSLLRLMMNGSSNRRERRSITIKRPSRDIPIGLEVTTGTSCDDSYFEVIKVLENSPASEARIRTGWLLTEVDGLSVRGWDLQSLVSILTTSTFSVRARRKTSFAITTNERTNERPNKRLCRCCSSPFWSRRPSPLPRSKKLPVSHPRRIKQKKKLESLHALVF